MTSAVGPQHPSPAHLCPLHTFPRAWDWAHPAPCPGRAAAGRRALSVCFSLGNCNLNCLEGLKDSGWCYSRGKKKKIWVFDVVGLPRSVRKSTREILLEFPCWTGAQEQQILVFCRWLSLSLAPERGNPIWLWSRWDLSSLLSRPLWFSGTGPTYPVDKQSQRGRIWQLPTGRSRMALQNPSWRILEEFMWVNQWFHRAGKLNLTPATGGSLPAPPALPTAQVECFTHRSTLGGGIAWEQCRAPCRINSEESLPGRNLALDVHTQLSSSSLSSFSKLTLIYLLQPQHSPSRSCKSDIPAFFEMGVLAKLWDVWEWAEQAPFVIICINTMLVVICQDPDAVQTAQKRDLIYSKLFNTLGLWLQMFWF